MEKQKISREKVLQDVTLQKDLKAVKEALEIQKLKEEIIGYVLLENNRDKLAELAEILKDEQSTCVKKSPGRGGGSGNG
jgi:hypothetical protein